MEWFYNRFWIVLLILVLVMLLPIRFQLEVDHRQRWNGILRISLLRFTKVIQLGTSATSVHKVEQQVMHRLENGNLEVVSKKQRGFIRNRLRDRWRRTSFQVYWRGLAVYATKVLRIVSRHSRVEDYQLYCNVGFSRPDWTAYLYGLFWTVLSALPQNWLEQGSITYLPDFQQKRQDVFLKGIIYCRVGQVMFILVSVFWITVTAMYQQRRLEHPATETIIKQNREEQMVYES